jgi:hypothetical protein
MKPVFVILISLSVFFFSCHNNTEKDQKEVLKKWEMAEVFDDEAVEWLEGGYCVYHFHENQKINDSSSNENSGEMVAILIQPEIKLNATKAVIYVNDSKYVLKLIKDDTKKGVRWNRIFSNDQFEVQLQMKIIEVIDGMDEEDMEIYSGKITIKNLETNETKTYNIKGGC